jgi:phosphatidylglycerol:prolipoprotein diacylglycerol transferase
MSVAALSAALPYFHLGSLDIGLPIQSFGVIVATGVLIGAALLRRYAEWHGVSDEHIRKLLGWVTICGFLGAHEFDMIAYNWDKIGEAVSSVEHPVVSWWFLPDELFPTHWPLPFRIWEGISSYGGFIGGAAGFAFYVWWKRLPARLFADITVVGLLPAFSIGRIGCTVVSDHIGAAVDRGAWYAGLAMNYPVSERLPAITELQQHDPKLVVDNHILAWNLGLIEFLYLVPVNALVLYLAFRRARPGKTDGVWIAQTNAGLLVVLTGLLYAPVRFFLDSLRPEETDPRHLGLTFAQWASFLAFGAAAYAAFRIFKHGAPAETIAATAGDAQRKLNMVLRDVETDKKDDLKADAPPAKPDEDETSGDEGVDDPPAPADKQTAAAKPGAIKTKRGKKK